MPSISGATAAALYQVVALHNHERGPSVSNAGGVIAKACLCDLSQPRLLASFMSKAQLFPVHFFSSSPWGVFGVPNSPGMVKRSISNCGD